MSFVLVNAISSSAATLDNTSTAERVLWKNTPIVVHIQNNHERMIHFPDEIRYWLPEQLQPNVRVMAANGVLYIQALRTFTLTRIRVQTLTNQRVYLLDIFADETPSLNNEMIVTTIESVTNKAKTLKKLQQKEDWRITLTRYAAQQLYSPERLLKNSFGIKRIPVSSNTLPLIRGGIMAATPIASWQGGGLTVTAVRIENRQNKALHLLFTPSENEASIDFSQFIRGDWITAMLQHNDLAPMHQAGDTTTLYLVSERSFEESIGFVVPASLQPKGD